MFHILKFLYIYFFEESILVKVDISPLLGYSALAKGDADSVISQYKKFLKEVVPENKSKFLDSSHRVDQLYHGLLAGSDDMVSCGQSFK